MKILKFFKLIILLVFISIIFTSCDKENIDSNGLVLIPLTTGNKWTYENYQGEDSNTSTLEIGEYIEINNYKGYKFLSGNRPYNSIFIVNNDDKGNFLSIGGYSDVDSLFSPSVNYKIDAIEGESWDYDNINVNYDSGIFEKDLIKMYCIKTDTTITTPIGTFNCMVFEYSPNSGDDIFRNYISKNIGLIKSEHYELNNLFSYMTLIDYNIK